MIRLFRSSSIVSACTGLSRVLGLVREVGMAYFFGTSLAKSAFDVAFVIPNLFRRLFGEGALSAAFVPVFAETMRKEGRNKANALAGRIAVLLGAVLIMIVLAGLLFAGVGLATGWGGARVTAMLPLLRIMLPYLFFICLAALSMGILNTYGHFLLPAVTPVLLNVVWIGTLVLVCPRFGPTTGERIVGVAWGILVAGVVQLAAQIPLLLKYRVRPVWSWRWRDPQVNRVLLLMGPAAVGMGVFQVNFLVDRVLAYTVADWGTAALTYAERLIHLPLGVFATALATVLLPTFSHQAAAADTDEIRRTLVTALRSLMLIVIPSAVGLFVLARPIVSLFFVWRGGIFDSASMEYTARAVCFYAPGLVVFSAYKVLVPAFYALKDTRTPVRIGLRAVLLNLVLNIVFVLSWPAGYKHAGLAFATVLSSGLSCVLLGVRLERRIGRVDWKGVCATVGKALGAAVLMGLAVAAAHARLAAALPSLLKSPKAVEVVGVVTAIGLGIGLYAVLVALVCRKELRLVLARRHPAP